MKKMRQIPFEGFLKMPIFFLSSAFLKQKHQVETGKLESKIWFRQSVHHKQPNICSKLWLFIFLRKNQRETTLFMLSEGCKTTKIINPSFKNLLFLSLQNVGVLTPCSVVCQGQDANVWNVKMSQFIFPFPTSPPQSCSYVGSVGLEIKCTM